MNRSAWLVGSTLAATAALLVAIAVGVVRQSARRSAGDSLEYHRLLSAVDELIVLDGSRRVLRFEIADTAFGRQHITYDTLVIEEAASSVPSLGPGGFLFDEVRSYNTFQRERLAIASRDPDRFHQLKSFNPSIFRSVRLDDGTLGVTRTSAAWNRRVQSPFDGGWYGELRTRDAAFGWGLHSPHGSLSFDRPRRIARRVDGRTQLCEFEPRENDAVAYCLSEARTPQAIFREAVSHSGDSRVVAGWAPLRVDGQRVRPGDSLRLEEGSVLRIAPLEPVVFGEYREGVLSSRQWINGRMRRRTDLPPPLDLFAALGRNAVDPENPPSPGANLVLSVSERASRTLTEALGDFVEDLPLSLEFGTVVLARIPDGAVLAVAEVGTRSEPGRSRLLERVVPGSAVKPLLAAAVLSERPALGGLEISARSGLVRSVLGARAVPASRAFATALNCGRPSSGRVDLHYFLRCSNNEYAAALVMAGLEGERAKGPISRSALLRSPLTQGMAALYGLHTDPVIADSLRRSRSVWDGLAFTDGTPVRVPFEVLPDQSRPALLASGSREDTDLDLLYRYAFGAWENRWNVFDLTRAFARVTTDRPVDLTFGSGPGAAGSRSDEDARAARGSGEPDGEPGSNTGGGHDGGGTASGSRTGVTGLGLSEHGWYSDLLRGLRDAPVNGTAGGLSERWRSAGLPDGLYAKTGTLSEPAARGGSGLFIKSLLFSVGESRGGGAEPLFCGITGTVYLSFEEGPGRRPLPSYQLDFAHRVLGGFLAERWEALAVCAEVEAGPAG